MVTTRPASTRTGAAVLGLVARSDATEGEDPIVTFTLCGPEPLSHGHGHQFGLTDAVLRTAPRPGARAAHGPIPATTGDHPRLPGAQRVRRRAGPLRHRPEVHIRTLAALGAAGAYPAAQAAFDDQASGDAVEALCFAPAPAVGKSQSRP
jgi:hypothetical protein